MHAHRINPNVIVIPKGAFLMGSWRGHDDEKPVHDVWIDEFRIGQFQVTNAEYQFFVGATGYRKPDAWSDEKFCDPNQPVVGVSWFDARSYCHWLSDLTGENYRLPTEAEWEKATRGGLAEMDYPWGAEPPQSQPDYDRRWKDSRPERVGQGQPNGYNLFNMGDNVHEWCSDWYDPAYYHYSPKKNPQGPENGRRRSSRGGSWRHQIKISRCTARSSLTPSYQYTDYGFRIVSSG